MKDSNYSDADFDLLVKNQIVAFSDATQTWQPLITLAPNAWILLAAVQHAFSLSFSRLAASMLSGAI